MRVTVRSAGLVAASAAVLAGASACGGSSSSGSTSGGGGSAASNSHRGGTLILDATGNPDYIDPGNAYQVKSWQTLITTNDGLLGFKKVGGKPGTQLVPDLATSIPKPTNGGKTYTFTVR